MTLVLCVVGSLIPSVSRGDPAVDLSPVLERWSARYEGAGNVGARAVALAPDGARLFVTGASTATPVVDSATVAYDTATGAQVWAAPYLGSEGGGMPGGATYDIAVTPDGRTVVVTGEGAGGGTGLDFVTVAYDAATGSRRWLARYDEAAKADVALALDVGPDGASVYVTGWSQGDTDGGAPDYATIAYDTATGNRRWVARYDGPAQNADVAHDVTVAPNGARVYVTGGSDSGGGSGTGQDYATIAYDAATGNRLWVARYDGPGSSYDVAIGLALSPEGARLFATGSSVGANGIAVDYATIAYDAASGTQQWVARYDGGREDYAQALAVSPDGSRVFVTGASRNHGLAHDYYTLAYDAASGTLRWDVRSSGTADDPDHAGGAFALAVSPDTSMVYVTGGGYEGADLSLDEQDHRIGPGYDFTTIAYGAADGSQGWVARYGGPGDDYARDLVVSPDGTRVYVTGSSSGSSSGGYATVSYCAPQSLTGTTACLKTT